MILGRPALARCGVRAVVLVLALLLASTSAAQQALSGLRLVPLAPDAPLVDLVVDDTLVLTDLAFGEASGYLTLDSGRHELRVYPHRPPSRPTAETDGATGVAQSSPPPVQPIEPFVITVRLEPDTYYTVVLSGFYNPPPPQEQLGSLIVEAEEGTTLTISGPRGLVINLDAGTPLPTLEPGSYTVTASRPGFQSAQYAAEVHSDATTTLPITLQRGDDEEQPVVQPATASVEEAQTPVWHRAQLQLYRDRFTLPAAGNASLRVVHASPITQPVDLLVGPVADADAPDADAPDLSAALLVSDLSFPNETGQLEHAAGRLRLQLRISGSDFVISELPALTLVAGAAYSIYLVGNVRDGYVVLLPGLDVLVTGGAP